MSYVIGIDLGGTKIAAALATKNGKIISESFLPTPQTNGIDIYRTIKKAIENVSKPYPGKKVSALGFGLPGQIDLEKGIVLNAPNLKGWNGFKLLTKIKKDYPKTACFIDNDANAAALAESMFGAGKKYQNFVYLTVSTGIGSGIILNKKLYYGSHQTAGEVGHIIIESNLGLKSRNKGKFELLASGTGMVKNLKGSIPTSSSLYKLTGNKKLSARQIFDQAKKGDKFALKTVETNGIYLAAGLTSLVNILDPEAVIIGGGLAQNGKIFFDSLKKGFKYFELMTPDKKIKILPAKLKTHSGLYGAIALALQK
jgi:glucokinase